MGMNSVFTIAKSSLFAHQQAISVTAANLANANNPAYSRQVALFGTMAPDHRASFAFGTGVKVQDVLRIRNQVTDVQIRNNNHKYFEAQKKSSTLLQIETLFSESSDYGLSTLMENFFNSFDEVALDPQSSSLRTSVIQSGQLVSEKISNVYSGISQTKFDLRSEAKNMVAQVNTIVEQLHIANKQIYEAAVVKNNVNDLVDTRDQLLEELSQYVSMNVNIDENNVANVSIGGVFAVDGIHFEKFVLEEKNDKIFLAMENGNAKASLNGGALNAITDIFNYDIPKQLKVLEELAVVLMENVNEIHSKGYTIGDPPQTGINFFTNYKDGVLEINEDIIDEPFNLAISEDGREGNNEIALELANLKSKEILNGKTLSESYSDFVTEIANEIRLQEQNAVSHSLVLNQLQQTKSEYSGVSTDEEMINIMRFQASYDAAAKLINVADDLMQTILNMV